MKSKRIFVIALAAGLMVLWSCVLFAQEEGKQEKPKTTIVIKTVEGEVSAINGQGIAIVYRKDLGENKDYEIYLPIDKNLRLEHKRSLEQINVGDIVRVHYEELNEFREEGAKASHKAKVITFLRPAQKKPEPVEPAENNE